MAIDKLQEKIRKRKNPSMITLELQPQQLPPQILEGAEDTAQAYGQACSALLKGLREHVGAVRVPMGMFLLLGERGSRELSGLLKQAKDLGYYVLLDVPELVTPAGAEMTAQMIFGSDRWPCDGVVISAYLGSDCIKPFLPYCSGEDKDIFVVAKTSNKSSQELQDLHTGSRQVHTAVMDLINRYGESCLGKFGYSRVAAVVGAGAPDAIRSLRSKYPRTFFLMDGYDYPSGNAKNCSFGFDRLGYGGVACAGSSVTAAWQNGESDGSDYVELAVEAALRMKKNLTRYVTVL